MTAHVVIEEPAQNSRMSWCIGRSGLLRITYCTTFSMKAVC